MVDIIMIMWYNSTISEVMKWHVKQSTDCGDVNYIKFGTQ